MSVATIDHQSLSHLVATGVVPDVHVVGRDGGWAVVVASGSASRTLTAQRSRQVRLFKRIDTLVAYLKDVGISRFEVDAGGYSLQTRERPDRSTAMRQTHEAAAHDKWFRARVQEALAEADDPETQWVSQEDAEASWEKMRAELRLKSAGGKA